MLTLQTSFKLLLLGGLVEVTVNSKEENSLDCCSNYVEEFGLRLLTGVRKLGGGGRLVGGGRARRWGQKRVDKRFVCKHWTMDIRIVHGKVWMMSSKPILATSRRESVSCNSLPLLPQFLYFNRQPSLFFLILSSFLSSLPVSSSPLSVVLSLSHLPPTSLYLFPFPFSQSNPPSFLIKRILPCNPKTPFSPPTPFCLLFSFWLP